MASRNKNSKKCSINLKDKDFDNDDFDACNFIVNEDCSLDISKLVSFFGYHDPEKEELLNSSIMDIIQRNDYEAFIYLLENGYKLQAMNDKGQTALHQAFYHNSHPIFTLLKKDDFCKLIDSDFIDCNGLTHFHIACAKGHKKLVEKLLRYTPDINARFHTDPNNFYNGFTPFHFAVTNCTRQREQIVKLLVKHGADVCATDSLGRTALHLACRVFDRPRAHPEFQISLKVMRVLVAKNHSDVNARDTHNDTPLLSIFPKKYNELETYHLHESHETEFIDETNEKLNFLLKHGADVTVSNNDGDNVLHLILKILRRVRFAPSTELRRFINCYDVLDENFIEFSHFDDHYEKMIEKLLQRRQIDFNARNHSGQTPLKLAVSCMNMYIVGMLLEHGADVSGLRFDEKDFFHYLNVIPNYDVVMILLDLLELLEANGFELTLEDNLQVLKFFVHNGTDCDCGSRKDGQLRYNNVKNLFCTGSPDHIKCILQKLSRERKLEIVDYYDYFSALADMKDYLDIVKAAKMYVNEEVENLMMQLITEEVSPGDSVSQFGDDSYAREEAPGIASVELTENLKLIDVLTMKPEDIPYHIVNTYFSREVVHEFHYCKEVLRGHMAKNVMRHYTVKSAENYFEVLLGFSIPQLLCRKILNFLSNEDMLNMCLAAMITDAEGQM